MVFTSGKNNVGVAAKKVQKYKKRAAELQTRVNFLEEKVERLKSKNRQLRSVLAGANILDIDVSGDHEILGSFVQLLRQNLSRKKNGRRYDSLQNFFALLSFMGPHYYGILSSTLMFPSYRTTQTYKQSLFEQLEIHDQLFSGGFSSILTVINQCLPSEFHGSIMMMVDAASVTPYVRVKPDGTVSGLSECTAINEWEAREMIRDPRKFGQFIQMHQNQLIKAEFTVMLAPIAEGYRPFPICCIPEKSGTATLEVVAKIESILHTLRSSDYRIVGLATDGDNAYKRYSSVLLHDILRDLDAFGNTCVANVLYDSDRVLHFSDPFHLAKRDRYRKVSGKPFSANPYNMFPEYVPDSLRDLGVPAYVLDNDAARKMEDSLPLQLFCQSVLVRICEQGDYHLFFCMLPTTLLLESIHSEFLTRQQRIDNLCLGASFMIIYLSLLRNEKSFFHGWKTPIVNQTRAAQCFSSDWCEEYISTTICIAALLVNEPSVNLGACGTHFLEHFFGSIRRLSRGDDTHKRFLSAVKNSYLERYLLKELKIPHINTQRRSDSGQTVSDEQEIAEISMIHYLRAAKRFMNNFIDFPESLQVSSLAPADEKMSLEDFCALIKLTPESFKSTISTKSESMTATGGLANCRRWKAAGQLGDAANDGG